MSISPVSTGGTTLLTPSKYSPLGSTPSSSSKSFLNYSDISPVQRLLNATKTEQAKRTNYMDSEDFLRMKAIEISKRISLYKNLGLSSEYSLAVAEGQEVDKKYQALIKGALSSSSTTSTTA